MITNCNKKFCSHCGAEMIETLSEAEKNMMHYGEGVYSEGVTVPFASPYSKFTGKRQYVYKYTCPLHKDHLWGMIYSKHDNYFIAEVITLEK